MRIPTSLMALSLVGACAPTVFSAVTVHDQDLTINFGMDIQTRAEYASGSAATPSAAAGSDFDAINARPGASDVAMYMRRARLLMAGQYQTDWSFYLGLLSDSADNTGYNNGNRAVKLFKAWIDRAFQVDDGIKMNLEGGLDYAFFNRAIVGDPDWLFCNQRATGNLLGVRGVGVMLMTSGSIFDWGINVMESQDPAKPAPTVASGSTRDGLFYSTRLEVSVLGGAKPKYKESYAGAPGHSLLLAADIGDDTSDYAVAGLKENQVGYGVEALFHWDGLSALAEARFLNNSGTSLTGGPNVDLKSRIFLVQAGYGIPVQGIVVEPALRFTRIQYNTADTGAAVNYDGNAVAGDPAQGLNGGADAESGSSGNQIDAGVNLYFNPMSRLQIDYSHWKAQAGPADENIVRVQWQLAF